MGGHLTLWDRHWSTRAGIAYSITPPRQTPWAQSSPHQGGHHHAGQDGGIHAACVPFLLLLSHPEHCAITACQLPMFLKDPLTSPHPKGISYYKPALETVYTGVKTKEGMNMCGLINTSWHYKLTKILNSAPTFLGSLKWWHKLPFTFSNDGYSKYSIQKHNRRYYFNIFIVWWIFFARMCMFKI